MGHVETLLAYRTMRALQEHDRRGAEGSFRIERSRWARWQDRVYRLFDKLLG
jgi:hypothetical protein